MIYQSQARYSEAEQYYRRALQLVEVAHGADHPEVAGALHNLGDLERDRGAYAEAERLFVRALHIVESRFGVDPPDRHTAKGPMPWQARSAIHCATRPASASGSRETSMRGLVAGICGFRQERGAAARRIAAMAAA